MLGCWQQDGWPDSGQVVLSAITPPRFFWLTPSKPSPECAIIRSTPDKVVRIVSTELVHVSQVRNHAVILLSRVVLNEAVSSPPRKCRIVTADIRLEVAQPPHEAIADFMFGVMKQ